MTRSLPILPLSLASTACRSAAPAAVPAAPAPPQASASPAPAPSASPRLPMSVRWVQRSAEYRASCAQTFRLATAAVERAAAGRAPGTWAIVSDGDETLISNVQYEAERAGEGRYGQPFDAASWMAWVRRREATALPGAVAFLRRVHELGGKVAVVTNRSKDECDDTRANFEAQGLAIDAMLCREDMSDKGPRFERVRSGQAF